MKWVKIFKTEKYRQILVENTLNSAGNPIIRVSTRGGDGTLDVQTVELHDGELSLMVECAKITFEGIGAKEAESLLDGTSVFSLVIKKGAGGVH